MAWLIDGPVLPGPDHWTEFLMLCRLATAVRHAALVAALGAVGPAAAQPKAPPTPPPLYTYTVPVGDPSATASCVLFDGLNIWVAVQDGGGGFVRKFNQAGVMLENIAVGVYPIELAFDGHNVWVTDYDSSDVTAVGEYGQVLKVIQLPSNANPEGILFDGRFIWTANNGAGANSVSKIDPKTLTLLATYPVDANPDGVAFDGTYIWVTNSNSNNVTRLDRQTGAIQRTYATGSFPLSIIFDGKNMWIGNGQSDSFGNYTTGSVTAIRAYGGVYLGSIPVGKTVRGLLYDGTYIWICNSADNSVTLLRAADGTRAGTYAAGPAPRALAYDGTRMWIANSTTNTLTVITQSSAPTVNSQFQPGGRSWFYGPTPTPLPKSATAIDAAFSSTATTRSRANIAAAVTAVSGLLLKTH